MTIIRSIRANIYIYIYIHSYYATIFFTMELNEIPLCFTIFDIRLLYPVIAKIDMM